MATGPEHYTAAQNMMAEASKYAVKAEEYLEIAQGSHLPEKEAYVTRAQAYAALYAGMMTQASTHATLANAAATALTGPVAAKEWTLELGDWGKVASDQFPTEF